MDELSEREKKILFLVIDEFIRFGEPVASSAVANREEVAVSSATVRNVMAELERAGYLAKPHTSAGRIPTAAGMRVYVDILSEQSVSALPVFDELEHPDSHDMRQVARWASTILSDLSRGAGLVLGPDPNRNKIRDARLVALDPRRVLAIFVTDEGSTIERITTFEEPLYPADLLPMQNYLIELGRGATLSALRAKVRQELTERRTRYRRFMTHALAVAHEVTQEHRADLHVEGAFKFVEWAEDMARLRDLLQAVEERERVIEILDQVCTARDPVAIIGPESGWDLGDDLSFVVCSYYRGEDQAGVVGVLGPLRMDYARVIPLVDHVARVLSRELDSRA